MGPEERGKALELLERKLQEDELPWTSVAEIADLPAASFRQVQEKIQAGEFEMGVNYTAANRVAQGLYGRGYALQVAMLASVGKILGLGLIVAAMATGDWLLLIGIPLLPFTTLAGNPYSQASASLISFLTIGAALAGAVLGIGWITVVAVAGLMSFGARRWLYRRNQQRLTELAVESEVVFMHLFHDGLIGLRDRLTDEQYWSQEAMLRKAQEVQQSSS